MHIALAVGHQPAFSPTEAEVRDFADKYVADVKVDVLNDLLLAEK